MVDFQFYPPGNIFQDDNNPKGMAGQTNVRLATSFYHSRNGAVAVPHTRNSKSHEEHDKFNRNAGAVQLYNKDGISIHRIPKIEDKEYHVISYGNTEFKDFTEEADGVQRSSYGHSERILMRDILDDLISADKSHSHDILRPSDNLNSRSPKALELVYEVLKKLTNEPEQYKKYLEKKNIIVKMWSERPACEKDPLDGVGGTCAEFIQKIFPEGSKFGFIVNNYIQGEDNRDGAPKVRDAFTEFKNSYLKYLSSSKV